MKYSEMHAIEKKINNTPYGCCFVVSDFLNVSNYENAKKCLLRLQNKGLIRRVIRGVYDKPYHSKIINELSTPKIEEVAKAIARNYNWCISPSGLISLNLLGLSTQVPNDYEYFSSGQYKSYKIGKINIQFRHKSSKDLLGLSFKSALVVNAIKELGVNIEDNSISIIRNHLSSREKETLLKEANDVTKWIYGVIKRICIQEEHYVQANKITKGRV